MKHWFRRPGVQAALAWLMAAYLRFALATIRWRQENRGCAEAVWDEPQPGRGGVIVCFWHSRIALSPACWPLDRAQEPRALISLSPDGQFIAGAVQRLGFPAIRGSSRKDTDPTNDKGGGAAFRDVLKWIKSGGGVAITPDGPRGPAESMKEGAPMLGRLSGAPVLFVGLASSPCLRLKSWDRAMIPLPFTHGAIVWDGGAPVARDADSVALAAGWAATLSAATRRRKSWSHEDSSACPFPLEGGRVGVGGEVRRHGSLWNKRLRSLVRPSPSVAGPTPAPDLSPLEGERSLRMSLPLDLRLYGWATAALEPLAPVLLGARARRGKEDPRRIGERLGHASLPRSEGPLVWLHGASVGESLSLLPLIDRLRAERPDLSVLITSGTVASAELVARRAPAGVIHQFAPVDAPGAVSRFLDHWQPDLAVFVESEVWPNLLMTAKARGTRLALISARLSDRSLAGWAKRPEAARTLFRGFDLVLAQTDGVADGLRALGARDHGRLNLKLAGAPLAVNQAALAALRDAAGDRPVLLAASTHPGEDEIVLDAFQRISGYALLVIVPRHPARAEEILHAAQDRAFDAALRTGQAFGAAHVYIADTLGEMGLWFSLAQAALIGGSLVPGPGGHNPIEPAQLGCPIISGPQVDNWQAIYADLIGAGAVAIARDALELTAAYTEVLLQPAAARARAERARQVIAAGETGLDAAVAALLKLLA